MLKFQAIYGFVKCNLQGYLLNNIKEKYKNLTLIFECQRNQQYIRVYIYVRVPLLFQNILTRFLN